MDCSVNRVHTVQYCSQRFRGTFSVFSMMKYEVLSIEYSRL